MIGSSRRGGRGAFTDPIVLTFFVGSLVTLLCLLSLLPLLSLLSLSLLFLSLPRVPLVQRKVAPTVNANCPKPSFGCRLAQTVGAQVFHR